MFNRPSIITVLLATVLIGSTNGTPQVESTTIDPIEDEIVQHQRQQPANQRCEDVRLKCAFRLDCGQALSSYMIHCADLIAGTVPKDQCPTKCFKALIALASTEQGAKLESCDCGDSAFCRLSKQRVEVCRARVEHEIAEDSVVSCSTAKFICSSNTQCLTALSYYNKFCRAMFRGKYCSRRCLNSFNILQRQRGAYKLRTCVCDGTEDFPCEAIKQNTELLCLKRANYTGGTSIELLPDEHRPVHHPLKHHRHHSDSGHPSQNHLHHHRIEAHRRLKHHRYPLLSANQPLSADFESAAAGQFETSPIDSEQIRKSVYFDVMMSEALSSPGIAVRSSPSCVYALAFALAWLRRR